MRAILGWYLGASREHYRCHTYWISEKRSVRIGNTVFFKHKYLTMPTITVADKILTATKDLQESLKGDIPQFQYDKGMVDKFIEVLNAKAKTYQIDKILTQRARTEAAQSQRVAADTNEDEDVCLDDEDIQETPPEPDTPALPAAKTRSRVGSGQRTVTQEVLMNVLDISSTGYVSN